MIQEGPGGSVPTVSLLSAGPLREKDGTSVMPLDIGCPSLFSLRFADSIFVGPREPGTQDSPDFYLERFHLVCWSLRGSRDLDRWIDLGKCCS